MTSSPVKLARLRDLTKGANPFDLYPYINATELNELLDEIERLDHKISKMIDPIDLLTWDDTDKLSPNLYLGSIFVAQIGMFGNKQKYTYRFVLSGSIRFSDHYSNELEARAAAERVVLYALRAKGNSPGDGEKTMGDF